MGAKSKNLLAVNKLLTNKNIELQQQVDELQIFKEMALKELAKLKSEIAEFDTCNNHLINGFFVKTHIDEDGEKALMITHEKKLVFFCEKPNQISILPCE